MRHHAKYAALGFGAALGIGVLVLLGPAIVRFASARLVPFFGWGLLVALALILTYAFIELFGGSTRGLVRGAADRIDQTWQHRRARRALNRRARATEEEQRARMLTKTARVHERAALAITEGQAQRELEELKISSERVLLRAQAHEIERFVLRYEVALTQITSSPHMTPGLKAKLLRDLREQLCAEIDGSQDTPRDSLLTTTRRP